MEAKVWASRTKQGKVEPEDGEYVRRIGEDRHGQRQINVTDPHKASYERVVSVWRVQHATGRRIGMIP